MERSCYRCGASIEGQSTFCPSCGAAQIRVTTEQPVAQPSPPNPVPDISSESIATGTPVGPPEQASTSGRRRSAMPIVFPLAILSALVYTFISLVGWLVLLGMVVWGVFRYQQRFGEISAGIGARIGSLMGFLTFIFLLALRWLASAVKLLPAFFSDADRQQMLKQIQQTAARSPNPKAEELMKWFTTDQGLTVLFVAGLVLLFILFLISATATGAVTGALTKKKPQQQ